MSVLYHIRIDLRILTRVFEASPAAGTCVRTALAAGGPYRTHVQRARSFGFIYTYVYVMRAQMPVVALVLLLSAAAPSAAFAAAAILGCIAPDNPNGCGCGWTKDECGARTLTCPIF